LRRLPFPLKYRFSTEKKNRLRPKSGLAYQLTPRMAAFYLGPTQGHDKMRRQLFQQVRAVTVVTITADGNPSFVTHSPVTIERPTRFGMTLKGDRPWIVCKPRALVWPPHPTFALGNNHLRSKNKLMEPTPRTG
jgi:hypothetical protein